jgi:hypothetical protein
MFMDFRTQCFTTCLEKLCLNYINTRRFVPFKLFSIYRNLKGTSSDTNGSAECISIFLTSLIVNSSQKRFFHVFKILKEFRKYIIILTFTKLFVDWRPFLHRPITLYKSLIFLLLISLFKIIHFAFQTFFLFVPKWIIEPACKLLWLSLFICFGFCSHFFHLMIKNANGHRYAYYKQTVDSFLWAPKVGDACVSFCE